VVNNEEAVMMDSQPPVRVGVIGTGIMGERHASTYDRLPDAALVGVFDLDQARAEAVAAQYGCRAFATRTDLLREVDAVSVASPTSTHEDTAALVLEHGVHLLIEKPMTATFAGAQRIAECAAAHPASVVMVGHVERFNPVVQALRRLLSGKHAVSVTMRRLSPFDYRCLDSTVIQDLMIHDIDLALDMFGNTLTCLYATGGLRRSQKLDYASAHFVGLAGPQVTLIASRVADRKLRMIEVLTEDAHIVADLLTRTLVVTHPAPGGSQQPSCTEYVEVAAGESLRSELEHFLDCARGRSQPPVDAIGGARVLECATMIETLVEGQLAPTSVEDALIASA
jgi:predicted dehydrogenase